MIIPYGDLKLCYFTGSIVIIANIVSVVIGFANGSLTTANLAMVEIQVISIVLATIFSGYATKVIGQVNAQKMTELNEEKEKTDSLLTRSLELSKAISIDKVFTAINQLMESNKEQNQSAETMALNFEKIKMCSHNINDVSSSLEKVISELAKSNENIVGSINNVSAVTEEVSARANETLTESERNALVVEEIARVMMALNDKAKQETNSSHN